MAEFYDSDTFITVAIIVYQEGTPDERRYSTLYMPSEQKFLKRNYRLSLKTNWTKNVKMACLFQDNFQAYQSGKSFFSNVQLE